MLNENKSHVSKQIYDLCKAFTVYDNFIKIPKDIQCNGFLIKKELIEALKKNIFYEKFCEAIRLSNFDYKTLKNSIEKICGTEEIRTNIVQTEFNNPNDLIKELDNNQFYLINYELWKIIGEQSSINYKGIDFKFNVKEITLIFNDNDKLKFKNNKFIISKETLIENQFSNSNNNTIQSFVANRIYNNSNIKEEQNIFGQNKKIRFKIEIKTLINLFFYYKELKDELIPQNPEFNSNNKNIIYLISKTWIKKYKSFFHYDKLRAHLIKKKNLSIKLSYNNKENSIEELIEKIESELPNEYIEEINNINNINELKTYEHKYDIKINKITNPINKELKYLNDYEIINNKIYGLFLYGKYFENSFIQKCNCYSINENNILIKFISEDKKYIDEIVCIEDNNSISPRYLLDYDGDINNLNNFLKNNFINFSNRNEEYYCEILNENKNIGYCYKIDSITKIEYQIENEKENLGFNNSSIYQANKEEVNGQNIGNENNESRIKESKNEINNIGNHLHEEQINLQLNNENNININKDNEDKKNNGYHNEVEKNENKDNENNVNKNQVNGNKDNKEIVNKNEIELIGGNKNNKIEIKLNNSIQIKENTIISIENNKNEGNPYENDIIKNNDTNKSVIKLLEPIKKGILTLIKYKESFLNLISKLHKSKLNNIISYMHVYLINNKFMDNYKKFYYYNKILNKIKINEDISLKAIEDFLTKNNYIKYFKERENKINYLDKLKNIKEFLVEEKLIDNEKIFYPKEFEIIIDEVMNTELINNICNNKLKYDCLINDGKVIIKFIYNNMFILLIGNIDLENKTNKFNLSLFLKYPDKNSLENDFNFLKNNNFQVFNQKFKNDGKNQVCQLFIFKDNNIIKHSNNKIEPKKDIFNILDQQKINHIIFLLRLYFHNERINCEINQSLEVNQNPNYYNLINIDLINKYKDYYNYDILVNILKQNEFNKLIASYKNNKSYISIDKINECTNNLIRMIPLEYLSMIKNKSIQPSFNNESYCVQHNLFKNKEGVFYYSNCGFIDGETFKLICNNNQEEIKLINGTKVNCIFGGNAILILFRDLMNIGIFKNNIFKPELIIQMKDINYLNYIISQLRQFQLQGFINSIKFDNNNISFYNLSFTIYKLSNGNEKPILGNHNNTNIIVLNPPNSNKLNQNTIIDNNHNNNFNEELKQLILFYIDFDEIKKKMKKVLIQNYNKNTFKDSSYYLLNYDWFMKFLELANMTHIYKFLMNNNIIESIENYNNLSQEEKINNIISKIEEKQLKLINKNINNLFSSIDNNLFNIKLDQKIINSRRCFFYYNQFLLLKEETFKLFTKNMKINYSNHKIFCLFGDNKIFLVPDIKNQYTIEIGNLNNQNYFIIESFFDYYEYSLLKESMNCFIDEGFEQYCNCSLLFKDGKDFASPIFSKKQEIIGYAYKNNDNIKEYKDYLTSNNLIMLVRFYLYSYHLRRIISQNKLKFKNYYLINEDWLKQYKIFFNYANLYKNLEKSPFLKNIVNNSCNVNNYNDINLLNEKKIVLIIKNLPSDINNYYNQIENNSKVNYINKNQIEPYIGKYYYKSDNFLCYFNKFEIINNTMYNKIFGQSQNSQQKNNYVQCLFYDQVIMIKLPQNVSGINKFILEVGMLNSDNIFYPSFILMYKDEKSFFNHLSYVINMTNNNILSFFTTLLFNKGNSLALYDEQDNKIGIIFNLYISGKNSYTNSNNSSRTIDNSSNINNNQDNNKQNNNNQKFNTINVHSQQNINNDIRQKFSNPPLIGLQNVGSSFYMNAVLQCFCQIRKLVNYFKYNSYINEVTSKYINKQCLTTSFKELVDNLWPSANHQNSNNKYYSPHNFKEKITQMEPLFQGVKLNDSKDLVNFIIMTLHEELNKSPKSQDSNASSLFIDSSKKDKVLQNFINNFIKENKSIISDLFYGLSETCTQCSNCNISKYNFQNYFFLSFPLEEISKYKNKNLVNSFKKMNQYMMNINQNSNYQNLSYFQMNAQNTNSVNIFDCFNYKQKVYFFNEDNAMYCYKCKAHHPASYCTKLYTLPQILIIYLNRRKENEYKVKLEFPEELDLNQYVIDKNNSYKYDLIGIVTHLRENEVNGHLIANCKSPIDGKWYQYNDDHVSKVENFANQIKDYSLPYILFYQKKYN